MIRPSSPLTMLLSRHTRRREFITLLGGAVAWPIAARAQQPAMHMIGYLDSRSPEAVADRLRGLRQGLKESGYIENENVVIAYRWAENQNMELWNWDGTLERIHHALYVAVREQEGREASPTVAIIDSQTAKGTQNGGLARSFGLRR